MSLDFLFLVFAVKIINLIRNKTKIFKIAIFLRYLNQVEMIYPNKL